MMSNAGPLTTSFTAPSSCATAAGLYQIWPANDSYYYEQGPLLSSTDCYPSGYSAEPEQYYSPGLCPSGYTPACSSTGVVSSTAAETAYTCCPTAATYTCAGAADALTSSSLPYFGCTTTFDQVLVLVSVTAVSDGSTDLVQSTTEGAGEGLGANSIAVRFRSGDFSAESGAASTSASTTTETFSLEASDTGTLAISVPTSTSSPDGSTSTTEEKHAGVSTTQAIGIGVGSAGLVLVATGMAGLFLWIRRRKQRIRAQIETPIPPPPPPPKDRRFHRPAAPPPLNLGQGRSRSHSYSHGSDGSSSSGIASVARSVNGKMIRGPFELQSHGGARGKAGLFEMYGGYRSSQSRGGSSAKSSADPLRSNTVTPSFWSPPPSYGEQPAELESPHSRATGDHRGRAELASP